MKDIKVQDILRGLYDRAVLSYDANPGVAGMDKREQIRTDAIDDACYAIDLLLGTTPVYVVAGNLREAQNWADERGIPRNRLRAITSPEGLMGLHGIMVDRVGTYYEREDWPELSLQIEIAEQP